MSETVEDKNLFSFETPIDELGLSTRAYHCCIRSGIYTLGDLYGKTYKEMSKIRNLGKKSLYEIEGKMHEYGLKFKPEESNNG